MLAQGASLTVLLLAAASAAQAGDTTLPSGGSVKAGSAAITQTGPGKLLVQQSSPTAIIGWNTFSIGSGAAAHFDNGSGATLNRVTGNVPSRLDGSLTATGSLFLVNPGGVVVGNGGRVATGGSFIASTHDVSDADFLAQGAMTFAGSSTADVVNYGTISSAMADVALIGRRVDNAGSISATNGTAALLAGYEVLMRETTGANGKFAVKVGGGDTEVVNTGSIQAAAAELRANGGNVLALAGNTDGVVTATGISRQAGRIFLTAGGGKVVSTGKVKAQRRTTEARSDGGDIFINADVVAVGGLLDASSASGIGGHIDVGGKDVALTAATLDASGAAGGGRIRVGGAYQGGDFGDLTVADTTNVDADSLLIASATDNGDGGQVIVWGTNEVQFHGTLDTMGGDNGSAEISTHGTGQIDGKALTGYLLVDPQDVCVESNANTCGGGAGLVTPAFVNVSTISGVLSIGGTFTINTTGTDVDGDGIADGGTLGGTGKVTFANTNIVVNNTTNNTAGTLVIQAADTIDTGNTVFSVAAGSNAGFNLELYAGSSLGGTPQSTADVIMGAQTISTGGGHVIFDAADDISINDPLLTGGGSVSLIARGGDSGSTLTIGAFGTTTDDHIDTTDGAGGAGAVTITADSIAFDSNAGTATGILGVIVANGTGGTVALRPFTNGRTINLGTVSAGSLSITDADIDRIAASVLRFGNANSGNITISAALSPAQATNLSLVTGSAIVDANASGADVTATGLALQATTSDGLETAVGNLAFNITGGPLSVSNTGAMNIAQVDGVAYSSASGAVTLSTASPMTFAASVVAGGNISATAGESGAVDTDTIIVNPFVIVQSTGGSVTLQAGDDFVIGSNTNISAAGVLNLSAGYNDTDGDGGLFIDKSDLLIGNPINLTALNDIALTPFSAFGSTVDVTSTGGAVSLVDTSKAYSFGVLSVTGNTGITLGATVSTTGNQTYNSPATLTVDTVLTSTGGGNITFNDTINGAHALTVNAGGNVSFNGAVGGTTALASLDATSGGTLANTAAIATANGAIDFTADTMTIGAGIDAGTGIVTLAPDTAGKTISLGSDLVGSLSLTDTKLDFITAGTLRIGSATAGTIDFAGLISLAPANIATLSLITGDQITNTNGGTDVQVANLALQAINGIGNDSQIDMDVDTVAALNTTEGGIALIESFIGGDLIVGTVDGVVGIRNTASAGFSPLLAIQLETNDGDLTVNNDIYTSRRNMFIVAQFQNGRNGVRTFTNNANIIDADSGASASNGKIDIRAGNMTLSTGSTITAMNRVILENDPASNAYTVAIDLGGIDGVATLGLTDAEIDTVTTPGVLQIGNSGSGNVTISSAISLTQATNLSMISSGTISGNALTVTGTTDLDASGAITLANAANDFGGTVTASGTNIALRDANGIVLGDVDASGSLTISAEGGSITGDGAGGAAGGDINAIGTTSLTASGAITLDDTFNDFGGAVSASGTNIVLSDVNSIVLGDIDATGSLTVTALGGAITETGGGSAGDAINVPGTTSFTASGAVTLDGAFNDFGGAVSASGTNITLADTNSIVLGDISASGSLNVSANGMITIEDNDGNPDTGPVVASGGATVLDADTVNLFGNLTATGGLSGTATVVNIDNETVTGTTGNGAEIQDAVDVALANAAIGDNVTISIAAGTYAGFEVTSDKTNLTVTGAGNDAGSITTVRTGSPAITISANGTTIRDMLLARGGTLDIGVLLNGAGTANLTGINIVNVDVTGLTFGVLSTGDIGDGNAATVDVTIRGNSGADRAVFEDITQAAIAVGDTDNDAVYLIKDLIFQDGSDADALSAGIDGIALGSIGAATIQGVNMTHDAGFDGIFIGPTLTNANILIGGPAAGDANTIRGLSDGIDTAILSGGTFVIQGNTLIQGNDDAIDINGSLLNNVFTLADNALLQGQTGAALSLGSVTDSTLTVSASTLTGATDGLKLMGSGSGSTLSVSGSALSGTTGAGLYVANSSGTLTIDLASTGGNTLTGTPSLYLSGTNLTLTGDTFGDTAFNSVGGGNYIVLANGGLFGPGNPTTLDAKGASFDGITGSTATPAELNTIEARLTHYPDDNTLGLIDISELFVVQGESIQQAVNAAGLLGGAQTVVIGDGTFGGSVELWVDDLTIQGNGATTIIDTDAVDPFANNGDVDNGFQVAAISRKSSSGDDTVTGVTIDGFAFTSSTAGSNTGVVLGEDTSAVRAAEGTTIRNSSFTDLLDGIDAPLLGDTTTIDSVTMSGIARRGFNQGDTFGVGTGDAIVIQHSSITAASNAVRFRRLLISGSAITLFDNTLVSTSDSAVQFAGGAGSTTIAIVDNAEIRGALDGILFDNLAGSAATYSRSNIIIAANADIIGESRDAIRVTDDLSNAIVTIGTATATVDGSAMAFGANGNIIGAQRGINLVRGIGGNSAVLAIANNDLIQGQTSDAISFGTFISLASVGIVGNTEIRGGEDGIEIFSVTRCGPCTTDNRPSLVIAGNDGIYGDGAANDGIRFVTSVFDADVTIGSGSFTVDGVNKAFGGNGQVVGGDGGISLGYLQRGSIVSIADNTLVQGKAGNGIEVDNQITENSSLAITGNAEILGNARGIELADVITSSAVTIAGNDAISGASEDGIRFAAALTDADVLIGGVAGTDANSITGGKIGIAAADISGGSFVVAGNSQVTGTVFSGIQVGGLSNNAWFGIVGNTEIRGTGLDGIDILQIVDSKALIGGNTGIHGDGDDGLFIGNGVFNSTVTVGSGTIDVGGTPTTYGGNGTILANNDAFDIDQISNSIFRVTGNTLIQGTNSEGLEFDNVVVNGSTVEVSGNASIHGGTSGIDFQSAVIDSTITITGNGISAATEDGVRVGKQAQGTTGITMTGNAIGTGAARIGGVGINFISGSVSTLPADLSGNTVFATGLAVNMATLAGALTINSGSYDGIGGALAIANANAGASVTIGAADFTGGAGSTVASLVTTNALSIDFAGGATFTGGATGLALSGAGIDVVGDTFGNIVFTGQTGDYITLANGTEFAPGNPTILDATGVSFDGVAGNAATVAQLRAVEMKLTHFPDDHTLGLINTNDFFVVDGESITDAVNVAAATAGAQTVTVEPGTFGPLALSLADLEMLGTGSAPTSTGDVLDIGNTGPLDVTLDATGTATLTGTLDFLDLMVSAGTVVLNGPQVTSAGDIVFVANSSFQNNAASPAALSPAGRWLVYSQDWDADTRGNLAGGNLYNRTFAADPPASLPAGNYHVYARQPILTVTADDKTRVYGDANPALTYMIAGLVNGDLAATAYRGTPVVTTSASTHTDVGNVPIDVALGTLASSIGYGFALVDGTLTITPRALTVTASAFDKVYDGSTLATATLGDDRLAGDILSLSYTAANFAEKNVGTNKLVTVTGIGVTGTDAGNYTFNMTATDLADITPRPLTVTAMAADKVYDGNTLTTANLSDDRVAGDMLSLSYAAANFADKNAATDKLVTVTGIGVTGTDAGNYTFNMTATDLADITPRALTVTASAMDKIYDGNTLATVNLSDDRVAGDQLSFSYSANFDTPYVGVNKLVTVSGIALGGADAGNYTANLTATDRASILPLLIINDDTESDQSMLTWFTDDCPDGGGGGQPDADGNWTVSSCVLPGTAGQ